MPTKQLDNNWIPNCQQLPSIVHCYCYIQSNISIQCEVQLPFAINSELQTAEYKSHTTILFMPVKVTSKFPKILCNCQFMKKTPKHAEPSSSKSKCSFVNYSCKTYHQYQYFLTWQPATQNAQSLIGLGYYQIKAACNSQRSYRKRITEKSTREKKLEVTNWNVRYTIQWKSSSKCEWVLTLRNVTISTNVSDP